MMVNYTIQETLKPMLSNRNTNKRKFEITPIKTHTLKLDNNKKFKDQTLEDQILQIEAVEVTEDKVDRALAQSRRIRPLYITKEWPTIKTTNKNSHR